MFAQLWNVCCTCTIYTVNILTLHMYMLIRDAEERKEERSKQGQINNKAKQHSTPKAVTFPKKNELPQVGLEPTTLYTLDRALYQLSYRCSSAGWAQISHLIVYLMNRPHVYTHRLEIWRRPCCNALSLDLSFKSYVTTSFIEPATSTLVEEIT